jgi:hypothetical protein
MLASFAMVARTRRWQRERCSTRMDATEPATTRNIASCSTNIEAASCSALIVLVIRDALDVVSPGVSMSRGAKRVAGTTTQ